MSTTKKGGHSYVMVLSTPQWLTATRDKIFQGKRILQQTQPCLVITRSSRTCGDDDALSFTTLLKNTSLAGQQKYILKTHLYHYHPILSVHKERVSPFPSTICALKKPPIKEVKKLTNTGELFLSKFDHYPSKMFPDT